MDTRLKKFWDLGVEESLRLEKEFPIDDDWIGTWWIGTWEAGQPL